MPIELIGHDAIILCLPEVLVVVIIIPIPAAVDDAESDTIDSPLFRGRLGFLLLCEAGCIVR